MAARPWRKASWAAVWVAPSHPFSVYSVVIRCRTCAARSAVDTARAGRQIVQSPRALRTGEVIVSGTQESVWIVAVDPGRADGRKTGCFDLVAEFEEFVPCLRLGPAVRAKKRSVIEDRPARVAEWQTIPAPIDNPRIKRTGEERIAPTRIAFPVRSIEKRRQIPEFAGAGGGETAG